MEDLVVIAAIWIIATRFTGAVVLGSAFSDTCVDSDGGRAYEIAGTTTAVGYSQNDVCDNRGFLTEKFCEKSLWTGKYKIGSERFNCAFKCVDGACVKSS